MENERKICAAYIRVSTHDQEEFSPESQIKIAQEYAAKNNMILPQEYIFRDDGISGRKAEKRPAFLQMIATAKEKPRRFDCILVWKFSRFARNQEESIFFKSLLKKENGIEVISISEPIMEGEFGSLIERIIEWFDAFYSANLANEVRRGMTERATRGLPNSTAPLGYRYENKRLVIEPDEAETVRSIYRDFIGGKGIQAIARELNARGLKTRRGKLWENRTVKYILTNPVYMGKIRWCPEGQNDYHKPHELLDATILTDGQQEPLISKEDFDAAQAKFEIYLQRYGGRGKKTQREAASWPLQGLVRCSSCGAVISRYNGTWSNCSGYMHGRCSESHFIGIEKLEKMVLASMKFELTKMTFEPVHRVKPWLDGEEQQVNQLLKREEEILRRHKEAYAGGVDSLEEYRANKSQCEARIKSLRKRLQELASPSPFDKKAYQAKCLEVLRSLEQDELPPQKKNELLRSFVDHVTYDKAANSLEIVYYYT